jgi:signal transduction histidine kinase
MDLIHLHNIKNKIFVAHNSIKKMITMINSEDLSRELLLKKAVIVDRSLDEISLIIQPQLHTKQVLRDLASVLRLSIDKLQVLPIQIILEIKSSAPILVNEESLDCLLLNILKNAVEAGAKLSVISLDQDKMTIVDDGVGLNEDSLLLLNQEKAFSTKKMGSGLGLETIQQICRKQNWAYKISHGKEDQALSGLKYIITFS